MNHLLPCPGCARHVRAIDADCPFCGEALPLSLRQQTPRLPTKRLGRAATLAFGAALAASGCGESHDSRVDGSMTLEDAGSDVDSGGSVALYGAPAVDAGPQEDSGTNVALYGAPSVDAGYDSGISVVPAYGVPAPDGGFDT